MIHIQMKLPVIINGFSSKIACKKFICHDVRNPIHYHSSGNPSQIKIGGIVIAGVHNPSTPQGGP